jgi:hypothetical protein
MSCISGINRGILDGADDEFKQAPSGSIVGAQFIGI